MISAYRPCHNLRDEFSTYKQHLRLLPSGSPKPRLAFVQDLQLQLSRWKECGDLLIVMLDANEDVCLGPVHDMFSSLELLNVMYDKAFPLFPPKRSSLQDLVICRLTLFSFPPLLNRDYGAIPFPGLTCPPIILAFGLIYRLPPFMVLPPSPTCPFPHHIV